MQVVMYLVRNGEFAGFLKMRNVEGGVYLPKHVSVVVPKIHQATCYKHGDEAFLAVCIANACFLDDCDEVKYRPRYPKDNSRFIMGLLPTKHASKQLSADWDRREQARRKK